MGRLYTVDNKLLIDTAEVRLGDKVYPVDDRQKTVKKLMKEVNQAKDVDGDTIDAALKLALGKDAFNEIDDMDMPFRAYQQFFEVVLAAMTGEDPKDVAARFQRPEETD